MQYVVVGVSHNTNVSKKNGLTYNNHYIHTTYTSDRVDGTAVEMFSYSGDFDKRIVVGCVVSPSYNKWGKIETVNFVENKNM